jgi:hypothetical protein
MRLMALASSVKLFHLLGMVGHYRALLLEAVLLLVDG